MLLFYDEILLIVYDTTRHISILINYLRKNLYAQYIANSVTFCTAASRLIVLDSLRELSQPTITATDKFLLSVFLSYQLLPYVFIFSQEIP